MITRAARVLTESHGRVTMVERDCCQPRRGHRRGCRRADTYTPSLPRRRELIEQLSEEFTDELAAAGAEIGDELAQARWLFCRQRLARTATGRTVLSPSRPLVEGRLRARVRAMRTVTVIGRRPRAHQHTRPAAHQRRRHARPLPGSTGDTWHHRKLAWS